MASKLKSIFKKQISEESKSQSKEISQETKAFQKVSFHTGDLILPDNSNQSIILRKKQGRKRNRTSLGAIEEILRCGICNERFKKPKMLPCQHTFCLSCLEKELSNSIGTPFKCASCFLIIKECLPDKLPTNLYIENMLQIIGNNEETSKNKIVPRSVIVNLSTKEIKCFKCDIVCNDEELCKHCMQTFCDTCWPQHVNNLKDELDVVAEQLENYACKIDSKVNEFRNKVDVIKERVVIEIETRILDLQKLREERIQKANSLYAKGEKSAKEIKEKICNAQVEVIDIKTEVSDPVQNNHEKVKIFLDLHSKMTELMGAVSVWEPDVSKIEITAPKIQHLDKAKSNQNHNLYYKNKLFTPKFVYEDKTMRRPSGLALDSKRNYLFVACPGNKPQVVVLDKKFKYIRSFYHAHMIAPQRVAYNEETEEVFVTDKGKNCIFVFHRKGDCLRKMCNKGSEREHLQSPEGISIHPTQRQIYIADTGNDRIVILNFEGSYQGSIGSKKSATAIDSLGNTFSVSVNHQKILNQPSDVAVSLTEVIVADTGNHKIKIFNQKGQLLHYIGGSGILRGLFRTPEVVQIDSKSNILVGDSENGRIQIFSRQGELLKMFGGKGSKSGEFGWISGLVVKPNLDIIISDNKNNTLQLF